MGLQNDNSKWVAIIISARGGGGGGGGNQGSLKFFWLPLSLKTRTLKLKTSGFGSWSKSQGKNP